jgi:hypothetical protein
MGGKLLTGDIAGEHLYALWQGNPRNGYPEQALFTPEEGITRAFVSVAHEHRAKGVLPTVGTTDMSYIR